MEVRMDRREFSKHMLVLGLGPRVGSAVDISKIGVRPGDYYEEPAKSDSES